jgi:hypothetical protein
MTFEPESTRIPTSLGDMSYQLYDPRPGSEEVKAAQFSAQILDQGDKVMRVSTGEMIQHMLPEEISIMQALLDAWRTRAAAGLIPSSP